MMRFWLVSTPILLLSAILMAANWIAQPPSTLRPKVFVIGLSKTGTTSIGDALALLGYKRLGWKDIRSRHLVHTWANGDYGALIDQTRFYDAFEDLPWPRMFREMAELYPDSKFILSLRTDEQVWLESMRRHVGRGAWQPYAWFYGATEVEGHEATILSAYRNHTADVREFFADEQERYAEMNIDDGDQNWDTLCSVAECPQGRIPAIPFPKSNTATHWNQNVLVDLLHWLWSWTVTRLEELSAASYYQGGRQTTNAILGACWSVIDVVEQACSELYFKLVVHQQAPLEVR
ncbi:hypothetical protein KC330_g7362 [Hortaea werneckii]|nr:hypothetical protein KC330_g7362 [Hortaea werneckii]